MAEFEVQGVFRDRTTGRAVHQITGTFPRESLAIAVAREELAFPTDPPPGARHIGARIVEHPNRGRSRVIWRERAGQPLLLANQVEGGVLVAAIAGAAALGIFLLTRRSTTTTTPEPDLIPTKPSAPLRPICVGTQSALNNWAASRGLIVVFLPQSRTAPTKNTLLEMGYSEARTLPEIIIAVTGNGGTTLNFWTYSRTSDAPTRDNSLRADYCETVT